MKIAFLCGNLQPGRDGVGDYSRRLAAELVRQGQACVLVALNDSQAHGNCPSHQEIEGITLPVLRLSNKISWVDRGAAVRGWLGNFKPDWISFQFVPFGFHPKGMRLGLGAWLESLNLNSAWHIMFHELWLGLGESAPAKDRIYGAVQRHITLNIIERLQPRIINTHAEPYLRVLKREGIPATILPLFSNIPRAEDDAWDKLLAPLLAKTMEAVPDRSVLYLAGVLGGVHPEWSAEQTVDVLLPLVRRSQKRLVLVFLGKNNLPPAAFNEMKQTMKGEAEIIVTGERSETEISQILNTLHLGLATSPREMIQKSGSVAAMLEHGLPVLVTRDDWHLRGASKLRVDPVPGLLSPADFSGLRTLPERYDEPLVPHNLQHIAHQFLMSINPAIVADTLALS